MLDSTARMLAVDEQVEAIEGQWPCTRTVIIEFPSREQAMAWYRSDDYQALARYRTAASDADIALIQGLAGG